MENTNDETPMTMDEMRQAERNLLRPAKNRIIPAKNRIRNRILSLQKITSLA